METIRTHAAEIDIVPNKSYLLTCNAFPHEFEILDLDVHPAVASQEMQTQATTGVTYWEGSIRAVGTKEERSIRAKGYVEMTGYDKNFDAPM